MTFYSGRILWLLYGRNDKSALRFDKFNFPNFRCILFLSTHTVQTRNHYFYLVLFWLLNGDSQSWNIYQKWQPKWHWDRIFSELFSFCLSVSFHRGSPYSYIIWGNEQRGPLLAVALKHTPTASMKTTTTTTTTTNSLECVQRSVQTTYLALPSVF
jgi:hypothetical protein